MTRIFQDLLATSPTLVKDAGPLRLRSMKQYRPQFSRRRFMKDSVLGARRTLPTSSCPRCGTNSVDIWRSPTANPKSLEATSKKVLAPGIGPDKRATNYAATSFVGKDKHELADLSTNHRSVSSRFGFAIVLYGTKVDRGDTERAVALVVEGIESLDPENVTGETLRDAVVDVLVRAQMMPEHSRK